MINEEFQAVSEATISDDTSQQENQLTSPKAKSKKKIIAPIVAVLLVFSVIISAIAIYTIKINRIKSAVFDQLWGTYVLQDESENKIYTLQFDIYGGNMFDCTLGTYYLDEETGLIIVPDSLFVSEEDYDDYEEYFYDYYPEDDYEYYFDYTLKVKGDDVQAVSTTMSDEILSFDLDADKNINQITLMSSNMSFVPIMNADTEVKNKLEEYSNYLLRFEDIDEIKAEFLSCSFVYQSVYKIDVSRFINKMFSSCEVEIVPDRENESKYVITVSGYCGMPYYSNKTVTFKYNYDEGTVYCNDDLLIYYAVYYANPF